MCYASSAFVPVYYYIRRAGISVADAARLISDSRSASPSRGKLCARLNTGDLSGLRTTAGIRTLRDSIAEARSLVLGRSLDSGFCGLSPRAVFRALRGLSAIELDKDLLFPLLKRWFVAS
jgi:hypothetical protein